MDFAGIIRRAWQVSWRHKALWILGLFAGATGSGYGGGWGGSGYRYNAQDLGNWGSTSGIPAEVSAWVQDWAAVLIAAGVMLVLIGLLWLVLSLAAQAGLVWEVNGAEEGRPVSLGEGWSVGFHYWGRVFLVGLVLMLPVVLLVLILGFSIVLAVVVPIVQNASPAWPAVAGIVFAGILAVPVFIVLGFVLGNMYLLAVRYLAIEDRSAMDAVRASWHALRHRLKDVFLMWLITLGLGIAFGFALAIPVATIAIGIGITAAVGVWPVAVLLGGLLLVVVIVLSAAWNTFTSAMWTIFFRRLTGRDAAYNQWVWSTQQGYGVAPQGGYYPPGTYPGGAPSPAAPPMAGYISPAQEAPPPAEPPPPPAEPPPPPAAPPPPDSDAR